MKRFIFIFIVLVILSTCIKAQSINYMKPYASSVAFCARVPNKSAFACTVRLQTDGNNHYWLQYECDYPNNVHGLRIGGRDCFGIWSFKKGQKMYLKLDNDDILELKCTSRKSEACGYKTMATSIETRYNVYSYFLLNNEQIEKLSSHGFKKMRGELKYEVYDFFLEHDVVTIDFQKLYQKIEEKNESEGKKQSRRENPLEDF